MDHFADGEEHCHNQETKFKSVDSFELAEAILLSPHNSDPEYSHSVVSGQQCSPRNENLLPDIFTVRRGDIFPGLFRIPETFIGVRD
ncbi:hypothetical protein TNCV_4441051 [Trichonephila clavipes]|nr:hypothetical protein TNCV_4441051 [Trichonephila clavipes]